MNKLQQSLRLNAIFSGVSGVSLVAFHGWFAEIFALANTTIFWVVGLALIFFAGTIVLEIFKQRRLAILWIITQDFLWVIGSVVLLIWQPLGISAQGNYLIAAIAVIVLAMGINQYLALQEKRK